MICGFALLATGSIHYSSSPSPDAPPQLAARHRKHHNATTTTAGGTTTVEITYEDLLEYVEVQRFLGELVVLDLNAEDEWPRDAKSPDSRQSDARPRALFPSFPGASPPVSPPKPHNPAILPGM